MNTRFLLLVTLACSLLTFTVQAKSEDKPRPGQGERPSPAKIFERLDTDMSGTLSAEEVKGPLSKQFAKIDADGNGQITKKELVVSHKKRLQTKERAASPKEMAAKLKEADTDGNGSISKAEATEAELQRLVKHFDKIDSNSDGEISKQELKAMQKGKKERKGRADDE